MKMELPKHINRIEVFYDGRCGMCCTFHEWVNRQERAYEVFFVPYQSPDAERIFPGVGTMDPAREMIVRTDTGKVYRGAEGWVMCLYGCTKYRETARKLARPPLLPVAKRACALLASNRHALSKVFFRKKDHEVRRQLHEIPVQAECGDHACVFPDRQQPETEQ